MPLPFFFRFIQLRANAMLTAAMLNLGLATAWVLFLFKTLPAHTPIAASGKVLIAAIPLIMFEIAITGIGVAVANEYAILVRRHDTDMEAISGMRKDLGEVLDYVNKLRTAIRVPDEPQRRATDAPDSTEHLRRGEA